MASDTAVVLGAADEDADGFVAAFAPEHVIDEGYIEVELPAYLGWNLPVFNFTTT